jgi:hypothetical protein
MSIHLFSPPRGRHRPARTATAGGRVDRLIDLVLLTYLPRPAASVVASRQVLPDASCPHPDPTPTCVWAPALTRTEP